MWPDIQIRFARALNSHLQPQQYGSRFGRSIRSPLFLIRRLIEMIARHSASRYILFLDGPRPFFDPISHRALEIALLRYGVPPRRTASIMALYHQSSFLFKISTPNSPHTLSVEASVKDVLLALIFSHLSSLLSK